MSLPVKVKDPDALLDYGFRWDKWLMEGDTILDSLWFAEEGITIESDDRDATKTRVWLSGGEIGKVYRVTNRIWTVGGRIDDRSFLVRIEQK